MSASSESERMPQRQLGELMTELGLISQEQLATVLEVQQQSKRPLGQIIVELGFASGAAVAHALAMQSGGALRTEYGFALGAPPVAEEADVEQTQTDLPKLRLAPTAVAPAIRPGAEPAEAGPGDDPAEPEAVVDLPALLEVEEVEEVVEVAEIEEPEAIETEAEALEIAPEETPDVEPEETPAEAEASADTPLTVEADPAELELLRGEVERLEAALAETQAEHEQKLARLQDGQEHATEELERLQAAAAEQERLLTDVERLEAALAEAQTTLDENQNRLQDEHERATAEIERLQTVLAEAGNDRGQEFTRLQEERDEVAAELERLHASLAEEQERHTAERDEIAAQRNRIQEELGDALEHLAAAGPAAEERDRLRAEVEQLESSLAQAHEAADSERERLLADVGRLESALAETQASAAEQERRLAEEQERHAGERDELTAQRDELTARRDESITQRDESIAQSERLQEELGDALERLAVLGPAAEERDGLRTEVERLQHILAEVRESSAAELRAVVEERDSLTAGLEEGRELLRQAERVRESQIALQAERDHAVAELERLQTVASEAQAEAEEQTRLLAEEQDLHHAERETLLAQRTLLEQELGSSIEQLAAAASAADEREAQLQLGSQRLHEALDAVRSLAAELVSGSEVPAEEPATDPAETEPAVEAESDEPDADPEAIDYSLFVPGPNGYELLPQTGVPPQAGQTVELVLPDREEPAIFEVVRRGRTLPDGDVCVYLAQV
jgi:hypothetical protein